MPNCDWGKDCNCRECEQKAMTGMKCMCYKPVQEIVDGVGYCDGCWQMKLNQDKIDECFKKLDDILFKR